MHRRKVTSDPLKIEGKEIPKDAFLVYTLGDVHLNEEVYPHAERFDPGRFEHEGIGSDEKVSKEGSRALTFLGWGAGMQ